MQASKLVHISNALGSLERLALSNKLERRLRHQINSKLNRAGLDGNGRFRRAEDGYVRALDVLQGFNIELGQVVNSHLFSPDSNTLNIDIAYSNPDDSFSPEDIRNSMLHISYTKLDDNRYEVLAYLT